MVKVRQGARSLTRLELRGVRRDRTANAGGFALLLLILFSFSAPARPASAQPALYRHLQILVAENFWGSIVQQEAGTHATVTSIISNPNADPHSYEPTTGDARLAAQAQYVVLNGAGYDTWVQRLLSANPVRGRRILNVADWVGKKQGDNPHLWYNPLYVVRMADRVSTDLQRMDPADARYFQKQHDRLLHTALKPYLNEITRIERKYHGVAVGATESIFVYLASSLHLHLITPPDFMKALSGGNEPTAQDKATFDDQLSHMNIKVLIFNSQNSTPYTASLVRKAKDQRIPVVAITETLQPARASFQTWQISQLKALSAALARATGH